MMLVLESVISPIEAKVLREATAELAFDDGRKTAGRFAQAVKTNSQASPSPELDALLLQVETALSDNAVFLSASRPKALAKMILSRYRVGQSYGLHVDDALMQGLRTDLSFTLFLAEPDSYDGGALIIEDHFEARAIKLNPGDMVLYPSTALHRVEDVTRGERLAVVGWLQSRIRNSEQREILFDMDQSVEAVFATEGKSALFDKLAKTRSNLLRMWADP